MVRDDAAKSHPGLPIHAEETDGHMRVLNAPDHQTERNLAIETDYATAHTASAQGAVPNTPTKGMDDASKWKRQQQQQQQTTTNRNKQQY
jgi:hypothetical protein